MKNRGIPPKVKMLTASAMLVALGVLFNCIGTLTGLFDMTGALLSSLLVLLAVLEFPALYQWLIYASVGILSVLLLPRGTGGWLFVAFLGYYPMLKKQLEKLPRLPAFLLKFGAFNLACFLAVVVLKFIMFPSGGLFDSFIYIFGVPDMDFGEVADAMMPGASEMMPWIANMGTYFAFFFLGFCNLMFLLCDIEMTLLTRVYLRKWREKLGFFKTK